MPIAKTARTLAGRFRNVCANVLLKKRGCSMPDIHGNLEGVRDHVIAELKTLYEYPVPDDCFMPQELLTQLCGYSASLNREIAIYLSRYGEVLDILIGRADHAQTGSKVATVGDVLRLAQNGDAIATRIISQAISYLVDTTSTMIMTYDPQELVIFCTWLSDQRALYFWMLDTLYSKSIFTQKHTAQVRLLEEKPLNGNAAAALAVQKALQAALINPS